MSRMNDLIGIDLSEEVEHDTSLLARFGWPFDATI